MVLFHFSQRSISWQSLITRVILCFSPSCFKDRHICPFLVFRDFLVVHHFSKILTCEFVATSACSASTPLGCISSNSVHLNTSILPPLINHFSLWLPIHSLKFNLDWSSSSQLLTCDLFWDRITDIKKSSCMELLILIRMPSFWIIKSNFFLVFFTKYLKNYLAFSFSVLASYVTIYDPSCGHSYFAPLLLFSVLF